MTSKINLTSSENKMAPELYLKVIESMPYGIIIANKDGSFILWNEKASYIMNVSTKAIAQQNWSEHFGVFSLDKKTMYTTEDLPMSKALSGQTVLDEKLYIKNAEMPTGIYLKVSSFPIIEGGEIQAAVVMFDDITKEQQLYESIIGKISDLEAYLKELTKQTLLKKD